MRKNLVYILTVVLIFCISINLYSIFISGTSRRSLPMQLFNSFVLPGPFFSEDRIVVVPHFLYRIKSAGIWTNWRNPSMESFNDYYAGTFHYYKLRQSNFERSLARRLAGRVGEKGMDGILQSTELKNLHAYLIKEHSISSIDSMEMIYVVETYAGLNEKVKLDTTFRLLYAHCCN
jgi:hypothetical protein